MTIARTQALKPTPDEDGPPADGSGMHVEARRADFLGRAAAFSARSRAANTRRAYRTAFADYSAWCADLDVPPLSPDPVQVGMYLAGLPERALTLSTIRLRATAIAAAHRASGHSLDLRHPAIASVISGIARTLGRRQRQVSPVLASELIAILEALPSSPAGARDRALLLIGFGGALRRSELVALDLADLAEAETGIKVLVRFSKSDQEGRGEEVGISRGGTPELCPVTALERWLDHRGRAHGPLFQRILKGGHIRAVRLCDRSIARIVKSAVAGAGLDPARYSGHSLRAGLATSAAIAGADLTHIMNQTRHRSAEVARRYVRDADIWRNNVSRLLFRG